MAAAHGLLQKARAYLDAQRRLIIVNSGGDGKSALEIRESDRERILEEIEHEISGTRVPVTPDLLSFKARRRGSLLPLMVNLGAALVVAAGIYGAIWLSGQREEQAAATATTLTTAEGKLLEALRQESQEQLAGKDREIADIRGKLAGLDRERDRIRADADARISAKEQELEVSLAAALEAERKKLPAGLSEEAAARRLAGRKTELRATADRDLAAFRAQAEAERAAQEQNAEKLRSEFEQSLTQAQADRSRILDDAARRQAELEAGYRQKQLALEQDKAAAVAQLEALRKAQEKENLVLDQFVSFYRQVKDDIAADRPDAALAVLAQFRAYLDDPSVSVLPAISRRRPVELFLIGSLEELAHARSAPAADAAATQSLVASAGLVTAVAALVQQGNAAFADKEYERARDIYLAALARIPAVQTGTERLAEIERISAEEDRRGTNALFAEGNAAYLAGDYGRAVARYRGGLEALAADRNIADTLVAQLTQIGAIRERATAAAAAAAPPVRDAAADEAARAALRAELAAATAEIERLRREAGEASAARDAAVAARDAAMADRDTAAAERDAAVAARDQAVGARDAALAERDQAMFRLATEQDRRAASLAGLAAFRARAAAAAPAAETETRESLVTLVETKVLVQKVLLSDAVLAEYPGLADRLDRYLEALAAENRSEAGLETLRDLDGVLAGLAAGTSPEIGQDVIARRTGNGQQEVLLDILDRLRTLLE